MAALHAEVEAICKRVRKLIIVREIAASHRIDEMNHLRLRKTLAVWKTNNDFDKIDVQDERQHRSQGHVCSVDIRNTATPMYILTPDDLSQLNNLPNACEQR